MLFCKYPDRFIFAIDSVQAEDWRNDYVRKVTIWRHNLHKLPPEVAEAIAHGNAERLWHLEPLP